MFTSFPTITYHWQSLPTITYHYQPLIGGLVGLVGRLVGWWVGGLLGLIEVHGSWLMTGKSLESIAALLRAKLLVIAAAAAVAVAAAAGK